MFFFPFFSRELDTDNIKPETNVKSIVQSLPSKYSKSIEESQRKILTDFSSTLNSVPYVFKHDLSAPNQGKMSIIATQIHANSTRILLQSCSVDLKKMMLNFNVKLIF